MGAVVHKAVGERDVWALNVGPIGHVAKVGCVGQENQTGHVGRVQSISVESEAIITLNS